MSGREPMARPVFVGNVDVDVDVLGLIRLQPQLQGADTGCRV